MWKLGSGKLIQLPDPARHKDFRLKLGREGCPIHSRFLLICFGALAASAAQIDPPRGEVQESVEWLTRSSELIIFGSPVRVYPDIVHPYKPGVNTPSFDEDVTVAVEKVLRGHYRSRLLTFRWHPDGVQSRSLKHMVDLTKDTSATYDLRMVFFLNRLTNETERRKRTGVFWKLRGNRLIGGPYALANGKIAFSIPAEIEAVQMEVANIKKEPTVATGDPDSDKFDHTEAKYPSSFLTPVKGSVALVVGGRVILIVPAYPKLEQLVLDLCSSRNWWDRQRGAYSLRSYPNSPSIEKLRSLLTDGQTDPWYSSDQKPCAEYPVRIAAYDTLRDLGVTVQKPILQECRER